jgi:UDP-N-acetylglucosamine enolpyruvyl transferase
MSGFGPEIGTESTHDHGRLRFCAPTGPLDRIKIVMDFVNVIATKAIMIMVGAAVRVDQASGGSGTSGWYSG